MTATAVAVQAVVGPHGDRRAPRLREAGLDRDQVALEHGLDLADVAELDLDLLAKRQQVELGDRAATVGELDRGLVDQPERQVDLDRLDRVLDGRGQPRAVDQHPHLGDAPGLQLRLGHGETVLHAGPAP